MITQEQQKQIETENKNIKETMDKISHRIVVFSGKGGVGKTTVSVNLAYGLQSLGYKIGLLDADVTGPNVPKMVGLDGEQLTHDKERLIPQKKNQLKVISMANAISPDQPVLWRGPLRSKLVNQFLGNVEWGRLDYLIADLPPGTGDEILTMTQKMIPDLALVVTTPQEVSLIDSARAINMAKKMDIPKICLIENMSGLICPSCGTRIELFGSGGGQKQAEEMHLQFLGSLPLCLQTRKFADKGKPIILEKRDLGISITIMEIVKKIEKYFFNKAGEYR